MLPGDLRHPIDLRISGPPPRDAMATLAHLDFLTAYLRVPEGTGCLREGGSAECDCRGGACGKRNGSSHRARTGRRRQKWIAKRKTLQFYGLHQRLAKSPDDRFPYSPRSRYCIFSFTSFHLSASSGAGLRSMIGFHTFDSSAFSAVNFRWSAGTSSSA